MHRTIIAGTAAFLIGVSPMAALAQTSTNQVDVDENTINTGIEDKVDNNTDRLQPEDDAAAAPAVMSGDPVEPTPTGVDRDENTVADDLSDKVDNNTDRLQPKD